MFSTRLTDFAGSQAVSSNRGSGKSRACIKSVNPTHNFPSANKLTSVASHSVNLSVCLASEGVSCLSVSRNFVEILCISEVPSYQISFKLVSTFKMDGGMDTDNYIKLTFFRELSSSINKIQFPAQVTLSPSPGHLANASILTSSLSLK